MPRQAIQEHAQALQVPYLVHFTQLANLRSILENGLLPRSQFGRLGRAPQINDPYRFDRHLDAISLSIAHPNGRMFYRCRQDRQNVQWVVLAIAPHILWSKRCGFCCNNAADNRMSSLSAWDIQQPAAFYGMFSELDGYKTRLEQRLKPFDPTDEQAEVLVFDAIQPEHILGVAFQSEAARQASTPYCEGKTLVMHGDSKGLFAARSYLRLRG